VVATKASAKPSVGPGARAPKPQGATAATKGSDPTRDTASSRAKKRERVVPKAATKAPKMETPFERNVRLAAELEALVGERKPEWNRAGRTEKENRPRTGKPLGPVKTGITKSVKGARTNVPRE
jgi:hypothetical protein